MSVAVINYLTEIQFGCGAIRELPNVLAKHGITRPLLVTDAGLIRCGLIERIGLNDAVVFSDVLTNPTADSVRAGVRAFCDSKCDGIVAVGGGSPIDCAKAISVLVTHAEPLEQYAVIRGGLPKITANKPKVIAIPTTAGTGSEVGRAALISFSDCCKLALISSHLIPTAAICDPELTVALPPRLTAATGMDAISHCVETYCSPKFNPVADAIALDGLGRAVLAIRRAVDNGQDVEARQDMLMASLQGGLTFQKGLGMVHSLSHPLGAVPGKSLHHGTLNAVLLPHVLSFNASVCETKFAAMAKLLSTTSSKLPQFFEGLIRDIGLPVSLAAMGVSEADLADIPDAAVQDHSTPTNPRSFNAADCEAILRAAL